ncbi:PEP-CTERM sorting domain-containing protein [Comamonadaceae bacterium G21597-S1]|nr:PEP-CTERM sorting domain-containing protein [Comamonadaceae bacterium G21597-S1]
MSNGAWRMAHGAWRMAKCCRIGPVRTAVFVMLTQIAMAGIAHAASSVDLTGRESRIALSTITGGVGTAGVAITPSPDAIVTQETAPSFLQLAGSDTVSTQDGVFSATLVAQWNLQQDYRMANAGSDVVLSASGSIAVVGSSSGSIGDVPSPGPFNHDQHNYQELHFSLSEDTDFSVQGSTWGGEYIQVRQAGSSTQFGGFNWAATYVPGETPVAWSFSGLLVAGDYIISNRLIPLANSGWDYSIVFQDAQVAAVPEPQTYAMLLAGLALLGVAARRRGI